MNPQDRLHKAVNKIIQARGAVVRVAAEWQAQGVETSPLTGPLLEIQEALAQLEALAAALPAPAAPPFVAAAPGSVDPPAKARPGAPAPSRRNAVARAAAPLPIPAVPGHPPTHRKRWIFQTFHAAPPAGKT
jgi:hypothetical protein